MYLQEVDSVYDLKWSDKINYSDIHHRTEYEFSKYNFEIANINMLKDFFNQSKDECKNLIRNSLPLPAYDYCLKCSHLFNLLDARGSISVTERARYILEIRELAKESAGLYLKIYETK
jgi:glycyl-tRNA synthetase alpha chain